MDHMWDGPFEVHGGITFSGCLSEIKGQDEMIYVVGFDTAHAWDLSPNLSWSIPGGTYKNLEFVTNETKSLAEQVAATLPNQEAMDLLS